MKIFYPQKKKTFLTETLLEWGKKNFSEFPWRYTSNHWHALAAELMLQRTNADQVEPVYNRFTNKYPSPNSFVKEDNPGIFNTLGLKWREKVLKSLAETLEDTDIPEDRKELQNLPGVGDYIASAYRSLHLNQFDFIIDSNIVRIYGRLIGFKTHAETRRKKWFIDLVKEITPCINHREYNYAIIDFTRKICKPTPLCSQCPLKNMCDFNLRKEFN